MQDMESEDDSHTESEADDELESLSDVDIWSEYTDSGEEDDD